MLNVICLKVSGTPNKTLSLVKIFDELHIICNSNFPERISLMIYAQKTNKASCVFSFKFLESLSLTISITLRKIGLSSSLNSNSLVKGRTSASPSIRASILINFLLESWPWGDRSCKCFPYHDRIWVLLECPPLDLSL